MLGKVKQYLAVWLIGLPIALGAAYYVLIAKDRFVSESIISVRQSSDVATTAISGIASLLAGGNPQSREETLFLKEYVHSLDMLNYLQSRLKLREAYGAESLDVFYRLRPDASQEWFLDYYRNRVEVLFDDTTGLLTLRVQGFEPAFAKAMNMEILAQSERFVNESSHKLARDQLAFAEGELRKANARLQEAKSKLIAFQNRHGVFDPVAQAQATASLTGQLEADVARKEAELKAMLGFMQDGAPAVVSLRNEISSLKAQLQVERDKVASGTGQRLNRLAAEYHNLALEAGFAEEAYKAALTAIETTRIEATRKIKSLVVVEAPTLPEVAVYPERLYNLLTLLVALMLLYGIVQLVIATIQDHRD